MARGGAVRLVQPLRRPLMERVAPTVAARATTSRPTAATHGAGVAGGDESRQAQARPDRARPEPGMKGQPVLAYVGLGANLGDTTAALQAALKALADLPSVQL